MWIMEALDGRCDGVVPTALLASHSCGWMMKPENSGSTKNGLKRVDLVLWGISPHARNKGFLRYNSMLIVVHLRAYGSASPYHHHRS